MIWLGDRYWNPARPPSDAVSIDILKSKIENYLNYINHKRMILLLNCLCTLCYLNRAQDGLIYRLLMSLSQAICYPNIF